MALAYLWSLAPTGREPFDEFWRSLPRDNMRRFSATIAAWRDIYRHLGIRQDDELAMAIWRRCEVAQKEARE